MEIQDNKIFSREINAALEKCLRLNIPFALILPPRKIKPRFFASLSSGHSPIDVSGNFKDGFAVGFFAESAQEAVYIPADLDIKAILDIPEEMKPLSAPFENIPAESTNFMSYYAIAHEVIETLKKEGGKTVFSRIIRFDTSVPLITVASRYFSEMKNTFRYLYYTPETGLWIGASPELLYNWDKKTGLFRTMALAGTRRSKSALPWDEKNTVEHRFVTDFILSVFDELGSPAKVSLSSSMGYGNLEHICETIDGITTIPPAKVLDKLNPTPAVCGWPVDESLKMINYFEPHGRSCYGGFVSVTDKKTFTAYVNLRCAAVRKNDDGSWGFAIYAGGGLTKDSSPLDEWKEAASKAAFLYEAANRDNCLPHISVNELTETSLTKEFDKVIKTKTLTGDING